MEIESATGNGRSTTELTTTKWRIQSPAAEKWAGGEESPAYLVWEDLTVVLPNYGNGPSKRLLQDLNGYAEPGKILAILGPSGSGKSTLLDSLAGRLAKNLVLSGKVLVNGKKRRMAYGVVAYVTQENVLPGTLTVRETITYSANLRLSTQMSSEERREVVETTIMEMGLHDCAERQIGNWHIRGIRSGEKKRLSIALEILTRPRLLFLDEPTSGLDSASAFIVIQTLRSLACGGRTVVSSIHQPSSQVFALFDGLFLLSGGEAVYFGDARSATDGSFASLMNGISNGKGGYMQVKEYKRQLKLEETSKQKKAMQAQEIESHSRGITQTVADRSHGFISSPKPKRRQASKRKQCKREPKPKR